MDNIKRSRFKFYGSGSMLFGIYFLNLIFTILTFGLYYPWARAKLLQYFYGETELEGSRFRFHGTGKEMFLGFIKAIALIAGLNALVIAAQLSEITEIKIAALGLYFLSILAIVPYAIHGAFRYRMSRTSFKGIHFGYRGKLKELFWLFLNGILLTVITLGIYSPWFTVSIRKYLINHIKVGNAELEYDGTGLELFLINLKGIVLTILSFGIYIFWYLRNLNRFYINHIRVKQNGTPFRLHTNITAGNILVITVATYASLFTFGLALPWAIIYKYRVFFDSISIEEGFDTEMLEQTEENYRDATGEDLTDMLDIGMV